MSIVHFELTQHDDTLAHDQLRATLTHVMADYDKVVEIGHVPLEVERKVFNATGMCVMAYHEARSGGTYAGIEVIPDRAFGEGQTWLVLGYEADNELRAWEGLRETIRTYFGS